MMTVRRRPRWEDVSRMFHQRLQFAIELQLMGEDFTGRKSASELLDCLTVTIGLEDRVGEWIGGSLGSGCEMKCVMFTSCENPTE